MPQHMKRTWARATDFAVSLATGLTLVNMLSDFEVEMGVNEIRGTFSAFYGEFVIKPQAILATGNMGHFAIGIGVLDRTTSIATCPNPLTQSFPWLHKWESFIHPQAHESSAGTFTFQELRHVCEIHSQRVMRFNETVFAVFSHSLGAALNMTVAGNILLKE